MGLENDIKQKHFRNEWQKAMINLTFTHNWLSEKFKTFLDRFDLTSQQFNILRILRGAGEPLSTLQIRERMLDKMSDTSRIVDRLILKGFVKKSTCPHDKRLVDVVISEAGLQVLSQIDDLSGEMDNIINGLSSDDACELNRLLDKVREGVAAN
jgi:MarR family transcriptional regulator, 2-MHQ and catechol-resistance regulon repressor